jgi:hypothetical protein
MKGLNIEDEDLRRTHLKSRRRKLAPLVGLAIGVLLLVGVPNQVRNLDWSLLPFDRDRGAASRIANQWEHVSCSPSYNHH